MQNVGGMLPRIIRCSEMCFRTTHVWGNEVLNPEWSILYQTMVRAQCIQ